MIAFALACGDSTADPAGTTTTASTGAESTSTSSGSSTAVADTSTGSFASEVPGSQTIPPGLDLAFPDTYAAIEANEFRGDFIAVMTDFRSAAPAADFIAQANRIGLRTALLALPEGTETSALFADLRRSDHASFWDEGYRGTVLLTDSANFRNEHYHCEMGPDEIADLDHDFAVGVARVTAGAAASTAGM